MGEERIWEACKSSTVRSKPSIQSSFMTPLMFFDSSKVYLPYMLLLCRVHITLLVYYSDSRIHITAQQDEAGSSRLLSAFAKGEEYHVQTFRNNTSCRNPKEQLRAYFQHRGWQVREMKERA